MTSENENEQEIGGETPTEKGDEPVGGVPRHPATSEAPQVSTSTVEVAEDGGRVDLEPILTARLSKGGK